MEVILVMRTVPLVGMAILGGGLAGMILARRGIFRRTLFGSVGAGVVAANLYPEDYQKYKAETSKLVCGTVKDTTGERTRAVPFHEYSC